ncbi:MAG: DUF86 domain-containing protein [bacterium]|nr:DUF86 domain-containing protein [bacterium]
MTSGRTYLDYLEDIQDVIEKVAEFIQDMTFEQFRKDTKTTFAVVRALEILGEATKSIPDPVRQRYPEVPWRDMAGMRDKLTHHYFGIDLHVVWKTATQDVPGLAPQIARISSDSEG